jgi:hypothetical protein
VYGVDKSKEWQTADCPKKWIPLGRRERENRELSEGNPGYSGRKRSGRTVDG